MKHIVRKQTRRAGIALAAVAACAALGTGTAQAQEFASATVALDREGNLECKFRETGLIPGTQVRYDCRSEYVGMMQQCMYRGLPASNNNLLIFQNIHPEELEHFEVGNNGQARGTVITNIPESETNAPLCTAPSELTTTAVRWCTNSLVDLTNSVVGPTVPELFVQLENGGTGFVPGCEDLAEGPFTTPGE
jgi:hypothetical protein